MMRDLFMVTTILDRVPPLKVFSPWLATLCASYAEYADVLFAPSLFNFVLPASPQHVAPVADSMMKTLILWWGATSQRD